MLNFSDLLLFLINFAQIEFEKVWPGVVFNVGGNVFIASIKAAELAFTAIWFRVLIV
jgi:hypothetical protein